MGTQSAWQGSMVPAMHLIFMALGFSALAQAGDSLDCHLDGSAWSGPVLERQSLVTGKDEKREIDVSLSPNNYLAVLQDNEKKLRVAFTGSSQAVYGAEARLSLDGSPFFCKRAKSDFVPPVTKPSYLMCILDKVLFVAGTQQEPTREFSNVRASFGFRLPVKVGAENEKYSYQVRFDRFDPKGGLSLNLTDKSSGHVVTFQGPAQTMSTSFMLALTQGDRNADATYLRLTCLFTPNPKAFEK